MATSRSSTASESDRPRSTRPLPAGWLLGLSDIVRSTAAIAGGALQGSQHGRRLGDRGRGQRARTATFLSCSAATARASRLPPRKRRLAREVLAAVAAWVRDAFGLELRVALVPVAEMRAEGHDVRVARFARLARRVLRHVHRRRAGLCGAADEGRRIRRSAGAGGHHARPHRAVLPFRRDHRRERGHPVADRRCPAPAPTRRAFNALIGRGAGAGRGRREAGAPGAGGRPAADLALPGLEIEARRCAAAGLLVRQLGSSAHRLVAFAIFGLGLPRRRLRSADLSAPARREHRLPKIRRRPAHDARLHARPSPTGSRRC